VPDTSPHTAPETPPDTATDAAPLPTLPVPDEPSEAAAAASLATLVADWTTVPDIAERVGVPLSRVRQYLTDRELVSVRVGERNVVSVPAKFVTDEGPRPELKGTFTVLADGGMDDEAILRWLFTPDESLPVEGAPIDALISGHKTEVRRRAQALAL